MRWFAAVLGAALLALGLLSAIGVEVARPPFTVVLAIVGLAAGAALLAIGVRAAEQA